MRAAASTAVAVMTIVGRAWGGKTRAAVSLRGPRNVDRSTLRRLVPAVEALLDLGSGVGRLQCAVHHLRRHVPQLVLEIGRAARQDLVRVADGRLALPAPADELLRHLVLEL